jgi:hypothetical protein
MVCWEAMLNWLFYDKNLQEAVKESTGWTKYNPKTGKNELMEFKVLKDSLQIQYDNNELEHIFYES